MRILIVGAGIAGPTAAFWLRRAGHEVTLVEQAPQPRRGGYLIDFWGAGFDVAERMGIVPALLERGYLVRELREVDDDGRRIASLDPKRLIEVAGGRYVTVARADLAAMLFEALDDGADNRVETLFGETVESIDDDGDRVRVGFAGGSARVFDLVIGADGLHSRVRELVFGPEAAFERPLGIVVAAFDVDGYRPRDELVAVTHTEVGLQTLRFALRGGATMFMFTFGHDGDVPLHDIDAQRELLRSRLAGAGWEVPAILDRLDDARTFYLDRASQVRMPSWTRGRVALLGDAAACPSLLAGQGSALAMAEAYVLAAELRRAPDHGTAFAAFERRLAAAVHSKQDAALSLEVVFAPRNRRQLLMRNLGMRAASLPLVSRFVMRRSLRETIELPDAPAA